MPECISRCSARLQGPERTMTAPPLRVCPVISAAPLCSSSVLFHHALGTRRARQRRVLLVCVRQAARGVRERLLPPKRSGCVLKSSFAGSHACSRGQGCRGRKVKNGGQLIGWEERSRTSPRTCPPNWPRPPDSAGPCTVWQQRVTKHTIVYSRPFLLTLQASNNVGPPERLPVNVHDFLTVSMEFSDDLTKVAWEALRDLAWEVSLEIEDVRHMGRQYLQLFIDHGQSRGIAFYSICPPTRICLDPRCIQKIRGDSGQTRPRDLVEALTISVTVFTQDFGPIPGQSTSMYCRQCNTRYYANYYVHDGASTRTYYRGPFDFIHIGQHVFMASRTCELFTTMMVNAWYVLVLINITVESHVNIVRTSATNCAKIYNDGLGTHSFSPSLPAAYSKSLILTAEDVWNSLFLGRHFHKAPSQARRLEPALRTRNLRTSGTGQEAWNHACDLCVWINEIPDGRTCLRSVVVDGINMGCPCCDVHDCMIPLAFQSDRFCPEHDQMADRCVVTSCTTQAEEGFQTCPVPEHRKLEDYKNEHNKAMFQLKHRLARLKVSQPDLMISEGDVSGPHADEDLLIDSDGVCNDKPETGNRTLRARFGRRRTHNEELCVASCGVILGRATFYGSEAPNGVRTFLMRLFPTKASLPRVIWHDNNCRIRAMLQADEDSRLRTYFDNCALPVDVFHFKSKHKESDIDCGKFCNPYIWPDLRKEDGNWRFNSSAAEQANAWFGGYQSIVREMQVDRYNFFLDEMIKRRNRQTIKELKRKWRAPYQIPRHVLLIPDVD
ncbi:hypothetical protein FPV67DRAFT_1609768 [Lyophyllum atratum]|nr:hypothetical protein FPV67DRAFT_1609768 [Lyophyllum atratum]